MKEYALALKELISLVSLMFNPKAVKERRELYRAAQGKKALRFAQVYRRLDLELKDLMNSNKRDKVYLAKIKAIEKKKEDTWSKFNRLLIEE